MATDSFDYVIVGAGAAGSVLAARLTEEPGTTVCVLEAGPPDRNPWIHIPAGFIKTLVDPSCTWQFKTEPTANTGGRRISTTQGRTLGGSSSVNGMVYNRGQPDDLNNWAQRGNRGWGYADVLPYYRRTERRVGFGGEGRGREGSIPVTDMDWIHPVSEAFIAGCVGLGIPRNPDYNSGDQAGVGYFQRAILRGRRVSAARAFSSPPCRAPTSRSAPTPAPPPSCSRASARSACATSGSAAARRRRCGRGARWCCAAAR
jgi:choline dehydrogenase